MIYTPQKNPDQALILVASAVVIGILGGLFVDEFIMIVALIFWLQYTAVLSYYQFKHHHKHNWKSATDALLHPQLRFFLFAFLAAVGIFAILVHHWIYVGVAVLFAWAMFSINFYAYYYQFQKYEE